MRRQFRESFPDCRVGRAFMTHRFRESFPTSTHFHLQVVISIMTDYIYINQYGIVAI